MFSLIVKIGGDVTGFKLATDKASQIAGNFSKQLGQNISNAFGAAAVIAFGRSIIEAADKIGDLSEATGLSVQDVQALESILSKAGSSVETFTTFLNRLTQARRDAMAGNMELARTFKALGLSVDELSSNPAKLVQQIGEGLAKGNFTTEAETAILENLAGLKAGPKLRAALKEMAGGLTNKDFVGFSDQDVANASKMNDLMGSIWRSVKAFAMQNAGRFGGGVLGDYFQKVFPELNKPSPQTPGNNTFTPPKVEKTDAKDWLSIQKEIREIEFGRLTTDEKRKRIQEEIMSLQAAEVAFNRAQIPVEEDRAKLQRMRLEDELDKLKPDKLKQRTAPEVTDLQRIGAFVPGNGAESIQRRQLVEMQAVNRNTAETARKVGGAGEGIP